MTIQRTVLFGVICLLLSQTPDANAQCSRSLRYGLQSSYGYGRTVYANPHIVHRPVFHGPIVHAPAHIPDIAYEPLPHVTFGACSHVDDLSGRLEILMNELCLDLFYNYSHNPGFNETYAEAYSLYQIAQSIHVAQHNFDREFVSQQLAGADALFHHVASTVRGWSRVDRRQIGTLGIMTKLEMSGAILHHLMEDVGVTVGPIRETAPAPLELSPEVAPQPLSIVPQPPALP